MKTYKDINEKSICLGDIIDIHQTVNGHNLFYIKSLSPKLIIHYFNDPTKEYEYDPYQLLDYNMYSGDTDIEVIGNIYYNDIFDEFNI